MEKTNVSVKVNDLFENEIKLSDIKSADIIHLGANDYHLVHNNGSFKIQILQNCKEDSKYQFLVNGRKYDVAVEDHWVRLIKKMGLDKKANKKQTGLFAPMPGLIKSIEVQKGNSISEGDVLLVIEAMKMENQLKASADQRVKAINIKVGDVVEKNTELISFE